MYPMTTSAVGAPAALSKVLEIIGNTPDGVYAVDEFHRVILWNPGAYRILGYPSKEVLGRHCHEVVAGRDMEGNLVYQGECADMALARAGILVPSRDVIVRTRDGEEVWLNVTNIPVPPGFGGLSAVLHIFREVSARRNMEQLVERLSELVGRFAASQSRQPAVIHNQPERQELLTPREREVLHLLVEGANATSIAGTLVISPATARKHVQNILNKLKVHTTLEAVAYSSRHNLLNSSSRTEPPLA